MNLNHRSTKILVTGQSGSGKSTYFVRFISNAALGIYDKIFIFDHVGEISPRMGIPSVGSEEELIQSFERDKIIIFDPSVLFPGETDIAWDFFCEWCFERSSNNMGYSKLLAVDELQMFANTQRLSWEQCLVVETGRKFELDFLAISQQMNLIHNRLRNQLTEIVSFRQTDALVLDALEERGFDPNVLRSLAIGEYYIINFSSGAQVRGKLFNKPLDSQTKTPENESEIDDGENSTRVSEV